MSTWQYFFLPRLQNSPYFCVFKYARTVKQKQRRNIAFGTSKMPRLAQIFEQSSGMRQVCVSFFFSDHCIKQIDSMLPWICSVIDHRGRQNVVKTSVTTLLGFQHILTSSVIYYWTDARQHGIYLLNDARSRYWIWLGEYSSYVIMCCDQSQQRTGHATKPQINEGSCLRFSFLSAWLAVSLQRNNIPEISLVFTVISVWLNQCLMFDILHPYLLLMRNYELGWISTVA